MTDQPHQPISEQIFTVPRQLTKDNRKAITEAILALPRTPEMVVLDCTATRYIDSSGLGALVSLSKKLRERGQEIEMRHVNDDIVTLLDLTKLSCFFLADCKPKPRTRRRAIAPAPPVKQSGAVRAWTARIARWARGEPSA
jgi:anti-sigma B factor antagonist